MIVTGYHTGVIRIIDSPLGDGAVCAIGDNWFYFGGYEAEQESAASYVRAVPSEDIIREIYDVLEDFRKCEDFQDEYQYYASYLYEHGIHD